MNHSKVLRSLTENKLLNPPQNEVVTDNSQEVDDFINKLSDKQKRDLVQKLLGGGQSPITVILGECNAIDDYPALQLNQEPEKVADQLEKLSPDSVKALTEAIAMYIGKNK